MAWFEREVGPTSKVGPTFFGVGGGIGAVAVAAGIGVIVAGAAVAVLSVGWVGAGLGKDIGVDGGSWPPQAASPSAHTSSPARILNMLMWTLARLD
ncbi:MAG: hypothetical protein KA750_09805 [Thermoflexales bacterium]|nr:hypothetical protein [Thermoflexales bacterium]